MKKTIEGIIVIVSLSMNIIFIIYLNNHIEKCGELKEKYKKEKDSLIEIINRPDSIDYNCPKCNHQVKLTTKTYYGNRSK